MKGWMDGWRREAPSDGWTESGDGMYGLLDELEREVCSLRTKGRKRDELPSLEGVELTQILPPLSLPRPSLPTPTFDYIHPALPIPPKVAPAWSLAPSAPSLRPT